MIQTALKSISLLLVSNVFMTFAWYGHLKFKGRPLLMIIILSWGLAFFEYLFQIPANRIGHGVFSAAQLKIIQECITFFVFIIFNILYLQDKLRIYDIIAMILILCAVIIGLFGEKIF